MAAPRRTGRALELESANDGSESSGAFAPGEGPARVQVGPDAAPKRLDGGGRASKTGNVGPMGIGPAGPRSRRRPDESWSSRLGEMPNNMGQRWAPVAAPGRGPRRTGRDSDLEASWSRSQQTAGQRVPGRLRQVRIPPGLKLDPARRPKDWAAVAVPRRLGSADQWVSGRLGLGPVGGEDRRSPCGSLNNTGQRWPCL